MTTTSHAAGAKIDSGVTAAKTALELIAEVGRSLAEEQMALERRVDRALEYCDQIIKQQAESGDQFGAAGAVATNVAAILMGDTS